MFYCHSFSQVIPASSKCTSAWNPITPLSLKLELAPRPEKASLASPMKTLDFSAVQCCHMIVIISFEVHRFSGTDGMMRMICQGTRSLSCTSWKAYEPKEKNGCYMFDWSESSLNHGHDFEDVPPQRCIHEIFEKLQFLLNTCPCTWYARLSCLIAFFGAVGFVGGVFGLSVIVREQGWRREAPAKLTCS